MFIRKIIKLFASLFIIIFVPVFFVVIWLTIGNIEWQNLLKVGEKQIELFLPNYHIEAEKITTQGYGLKSLGTIFFRINNFSLNDIKNNTIKVNIKEAYFSLSIKDILLGNFLPIVYEANKVNIDLDLDKIGNKNDKLDTQSLISYAVNYLTTIIEHSLYAEIISNKGIKNISITLIKDNKKFTKLIIDSINTSVKYKKKGLFRKDKSVIYDFNFLVNSTPSNIQIKCYDNIEQYLLCKIKIKNLLFDPLFNEANKKHNLALSINSPFSIEANSYIKDNEIKILKGRFFSNDNFKILNTANNHTIDIDNIKSEFIITDNFQQIEINKLSATLNKKDIFYIDSLKADFFHKDKISIFDSGNITFRAHQFALEKLYYYWKIFSTQQADSVKKSLNNIFIAPNANVQPRGLVVWKNLKKDLPGNQSDIEITEYNIDIEATSNKAYIPSLNKMNLENVKVDINLKPTQTFVKFNNAEAFNSKIDGIEIFYENNLLKANINGKNQKLSSVLKVISHIINPDIIKKINIPTDKYALECNTIGKIEVPIISSIQKLYFRTDIDLKIITKNFKHLNTSISSDLATLNIKKSNKSNIINITGQMDNIVISDINPIKHDNCKFSIPISVSYKKNDQINNLNISNAELLCKNDTLFKADLSYNTKHAYYINIKAFKLFNNNLNALFLNDPITGYHLAVNGESINLAPFLKILSDSDVLNFHTEHNTINSNVVNVKIKTDATEKLHSIIDLVSQKKDSFTKISLVNADNIKIEFNIKDVFMINDYHMKNFRTALSITPKDGLIGDITGEITNSKIKETEYLIFSLLKKSNQSKDIYFRTSNINSIINATCAEPTQTIQDGDLMVRATMDKNKDINGILTLKDIFYRRKNARIFKDIKINEISSKMLYNYKTNIIKFEKGEIKGAGIRGNFDATLNLNNEYLNFLIYVGLGGTKYGIADIPLLGNILTLSTSDNRYLSGFKYHLRGYLNYELEGSLTTLNGLSWLTGYFPMVLLALSAT